MRGAMGKSVRTARTLLLVYYAYMLEYRAELIFWILSGSLPLIMLGIWNQAAQSGEFGFTPLEMSRYFLAVFFMRQLTVVWVIWDFERDVLEGRLTPRLLQPIDPAWHYFYSHLAERCARLPFVFLLLGLCFALYPEAFWLPSFNRGLICLLIAFLVFALRFAIQYTFAMAAFWIERATAIQQFWMLFYIFLSGMIAPLDLFPPLLKKLVYWTPFPYLLDFPAKILVGLPVNIGQGLLAVLGWLSLFFLLNRWLWRRGLKQYSGMGA